MEALLKNTALLSSENLFKQPAYLDDPEKGFFQSITSRFGISRFTNTKPGTARSSQEKQDSMIKSVFTGIDHISFTVKSIDETVKIYSDRYGIGPWKIWEIGPDIDDIDMIVGGKRIDYKIRVAMASIGTILFELIQPRDNASIYADFLKSNGEGFHHIGHKVEDFNDIMKYMDKIGIKELISGVWTSNGKKNKFVYLATGKNLKYIVELNYIDPGFCFPEPLDCYPVK